MSQGRDAKVYVNGSLVGTHPSPEQLAEQIRQARRRGDISEMVNVSVRDRTDEVIVNADAGRALPTAPGRRERRAPRRRRGRSPRSRTATWSSRNSSNAASVEFIDAAEEEEDILVGVEEDDLTEDHTHLEVDPQLIFGIGAGMIPLP